MTRNAIVAPSWGPLGVLLGPSWGPLGALQGLAGSLQGLCRVFAGSLQGGGPCKDPAKTLQSWSLGGLLGPS